MAHENMSMICRILLKLQRNESLKFLKFTEYVYTSIKSLLISICLKTHFSQTLQHIKFKFSVKVFFIMLLKFEVGYLLFIAKGAKCKQ